MMADDRRNLELRDQFLVECGLWSNFCDWLPTIPTPTPSAIEDKVDVSDGLATQIANETVPEDSDGYSKVAWYIARDAAIAALSLLHRREHQAAEAMRERCAVEVTLYQGIGVSSSNYLTEEVANLIAEAIRSLTTEVGKGAQ